MSLSSSTTSTPTTTLPYDITEQLRTPEEATVYLDAWFTTKLPKPHQLKPWGEANA